MSDQNVVSNPYDINGQNFSPEMYLQRLFKDCTLKEVLDCEGEIVRDTQSLHSDMQTLVYENYNKFISATDTVKKMKSDFKLMEDEMDQLATNMESITKFSEQISSTLQDTRQQFTKLSSIHSLLKRLQFLFKLPSKMTARIQEENYAMAVQDYLHAQRVLERYGSMASFQGIKVDCEKIVNELKTKLRQQFKSKETPAQQLAESVDLLLQLKEPPEVLCTEFLSYAEARLNEHLSRLEDSKNQDMIEFVDIGSGGFLSDLCLVVASYNDMFVNRLQSEADDTTVESDRGVERRLNEFVVKQMERYFSLVSGRVERHVERRVEQRVERQQEAADVADTAVLVRALDRFHRRLQAVNTLFHHSNFARKGMEIVLQAGDRQCKSHLEALKNHLDEALSRVRQALAAAASPMSPTTTPTTTMPMTPGKEEPGLDLAELVSLLIVAASEKTCAVLQDLQVFLEPELTFGVKAEFRQAFCIDALREGLVVAFIRHVNETSRAFCLPARQNTPPALLLILAKLCLEFETSIVHYLLSQTDFRFDVNVGASSAVTSSTELCAEMRAAAQQLLNHYVRVQGLSVSQMLRKSVEIRDWMHTIEPRTVRSVMKRVVEDVTAMDSQVGSLFEEGQRAERSSDSSRRTHSMSVSRQFRSAWSSYAPSQLDQSALASNLHKLFSERIEIFSSVNFSKVSILTGIIKIGLKTLLECVRLRTFNRFGLQQIQVDTHYLQLYLWRFVSDENLVLFLLGEVLSSTVHRCLDPVLMEPSVMDIICDRG